MIMNESTKTLLTTIAENLPKIKEQGFIEGQNAGGGVADGIIRLTDTLCIKAEEDGIWIEDNGVSVRLYSNDDNKIQAGYASYANTANCAYYDSEGRELKGTTIYEFGDSYAYVVLNDRETLSYGVVDYISVELPEDYYIGFASSVYFTTPSYVGDDFVQADGVYFKGDHTSEGVFTPEADTRYSIKFEYNGERFVATVSGVPANV